MMILQGFSLQYLLRILKICLVPDLPFAVSHYLRNNNRSGLSLAVLNVSNQEQIRWELLVVLTLFQLPQSYPFPCENRGSLLFLLRWTFASWLDCLVLAPPMWCRNVNRGSKTGGT